MTRLNTSLFACATLTAMLSAHSPHAFASFDDGPKQVVKAPTNALGPERVSMEPDADDRANSLHWSPDGARVAWMQMVRPSAKAKDKAIQREIWSFAPESGSASGSASASHSGESPLSHLGRPVQIVSAARATSSLHSPGAPAHRRLDDDDSSNPYLLVDFAWSSDHASLLLIGVQSLAWLDIASGKSRLFVSGDDAITDVNLSPDGRTVSFVRNHGLWLASLQGDGVAHAVAGPTEAFVPSTKQDVLEGEPDWPYRNELHLPCAYWWSPDSSRIAYLQTDDRAVSKYTLRASNGETRELVYPKPGGELPVVRIFVKPIAGGTPLEINLSESESPAKGVYIPRVMWLPDGRHLAFERLDRYQRVLDLFVADAVTGKSQLLLTEKDSYWINLADDLYFFKDGERFLWSSQRNNFRHLYLYSIQGKELAQLTHGDWEVTHLNSVDEGQGRIYFTATEKSPLERHLYQIGLDSKKMVRITQQTGTHEAHFAPNSTSYVDSYSSGTVQPRLDLIDSVASSTNATRAVASTAVPASSASSTTPAKTLSPAVTADSRPSHHEGPPIPVQPVGNVPWKAASDVRPDPGSSEVLQPVEFLNLKMHLGAEAHAFIIKPPNFDPSKKYPVIIYYAGGPGEQLVRDAWGGATGLWMQLMAQKGYILFGLDNQGTSARGHHFEEPIHLRLGGQELADQRDGLAYLSGLPYVDTNRLGVCGWGYGGYLVVHAMLDRPVAYKAGFAGAPVVDWRNYDAVFAERYLEDPVIRADGWDASTALENDSPFFFKGSLMIAQGTEDEFVHMENLLTLQDRLLDAGKAADVLLFSDRGHQIEDPSSRVVLFTRMTEFFVKNL